MAEFEIKASRGEFKGQPVLSLMSGDNDKFPFTFGISKARRILACIEDIKKFVAEADTKAEPKGKSVPVK